MISKFLVFLLIGTVAHAAITRPLDEMKVIEVPISQDGLTRIKVKEDRILHVFGNAGEYVLEVDENQGQVFIRPTSSEIENSRPSKSISLTLTTEAGHTQDLRLVPKDQAPEPLILKADNTIKQEIEKEKRASVPIFREEVEALIQALREERIPLGYKEMPISLVALNDSYVLVRGLQGQMLNGFTYYVHNNTNGILALSEPDVARALPTKEKALVAILISKKTLNPGEETDVHIVARTN